MTDTRRYLLQKGLRLADEADETNDLKTEKLSYAYAFAYHLLQDVPAEQISSVKPLVLSAMRGKRDQVILEEFQNEMWHKEMGRDRDPHDSIWPTVNALNEVIAVVESRIS